MTLSIDIDASRYPTRGQEDAGLELASSIGVGSYRWRRLTQFEFQRRAEMKYGARNKIEGIVRRVKKGSVMAQVDMDVPAGAQMSSVLTMDSLNDLGLKKGDRVRVVVKAIHVLLVKD
jgi:molybdopterin-binding protein